MGTRQSTTQSQHRFSQIPSANIPRSSLDRSHGLKTTFDSGFLIPFFADEALPGDTLNLRATCFARLATPIHPIFDNMYLETHFFAVPNRLLWQNWERFNGEQDSPGASTDFLVPQINSAPTTGNLIGSMSDYLGLPVLVEGLSTSAFWHRAYALIYNEWFRDENLQNAAPLATGDGPDATVTYPLRRRGKRHDYFTSCLPWPQKGEAVALPLGISAPVVATGDATPLFGFVSEAQDSNLRANTGDSDAHWTANYTSTDPAMWVDPKLEADLSLATAATINQLRDAFAAQKLLERDARGGTRYTEVLRSHFGVISPDARLQRPEYLGGGSQPINITPIAQTTPSNIVPDVSPQGNLAGFGIASGTTGGFNKSFTEHCTILGLVSVRADLNYSQGIPRMFSRKTRYDYYWPAFAHLGEQPVLQQEIFASGIPAEDELVFGYQERWSEYRYKAGQITGQMRSNAPTSLDTWHLAQDFATAPILNSTFIQEDPPISRIIAVPSEPEFIMDVWFDYKCARPMPVYSVPGQIDRF